jgi:hypothetical protein
MKHESFCKIQWKKGLGVAAGNQKPNFESEGPRPFFSRHQKLSLKLNQQWRGLLDAH